MKPANQDENQPSNDALQPGDLVTHPTHGVGIYQGTRTLPDSGDAQYIQLEFADGDHVYLPIAQLQRLVKHPEKAALAKLTREWRSYTPYSRGSAKSK
jgi:transcription-repair coupling factor (superfamily II helicase)